MVLQPPPRPPKIADQATSQYLNELHRWANDFYVKMGSASGAAKISVTGAAATITDPLPASQITGTLPIANGGTGAATAVAAATNLGVQSAISPGTSGEVPISDGTDFITRGLTRTDITGIPLTQYKPAVALTAASGAAIGDHGDTVITWDAPFIDANYTLQFTVAPATGVPIATIVSKLASSCTVRITNATAVQCTGTGEVTGTHA